MKCVNEHSVLRIGFKELLLLADPVPISYDKDYYRGLSPRTFVYFVREAGENGAIKVGESWNPALRVKSLQVGNPRKLRLIAVIKEERLPIERIIHRLLDDSRIQGEWFAMSPILEEMIRLWGRLL